MINLPEISKLKELKPSWDYLKETKLPIFIYGMGDGCLKLLREFGKYKIPIAGIFASDEFVRGHSFEGHLVHKLSEIEEALGCGNFVIALAFAAGYDSLIRRIDEIDNRNILLAPDTDAIGVGAFTMDMLCDNINKIESVYNSLADEMSKQAYYNVLAFKITGELHYLRTCTTTPDEAFENILKPTENEIYVDLGAYTGDTIAELLSYTNGKYERIYALEPNARNFRKLKANTENMDNCIIENAAAWNGEDILIFNPGGGRQSQVSKKGIETKATSVDILLKGEKATYIKYDVEGAEGQAIEGTTQTIKKYKPKLCVALYHRAADVFELPLQILDICPEYKLYVRHYPYYPAWETNLFCV